MNYVKIAGLFLAGAALAAVVAWFLALLDKADAVDAYRACAKSAATASAPLDACEPAMRATIEAARSAAACEVALAPQPTGTPQLYAIRAVCGEQVKRIDADLAATRFNLADAQAQIAAASADRDQAVQRAEARTTQSADRKTDNDRILQTAPRTANGDVRCDAECLRVLSGG